MAGVFEEMKRYNCNKGSNREQVEQNKISEQKDHRSIRQWDSIMVIREVEGNKIAVITKGDGIQ